MRKKVTSLLLSAAMLFSYAMPVLAEETEHQHNVTEWETTLEPTCSDTGLESGTCSECGETVEQTVPACGHSWDNCVSNDDGTHTVTCTRCDAQETSDCTYEDTTDGAEITHTCTECGYSYTEEPDSVLDDQERTEASDAEEDTERDYSDTEVPDAVSDDQELTEVSDVEEITERDYSYAQDSGEEQVIASWDFETGEQGWTFIDKDYDNITWKRGSYSSHSGDACLRSEACTKRDVNNWAISPSFSLEYYTNAVLSVWIKSYDSNNNVEYFELYAGTSNDPAQMTKIQGKTQAEYAFTQYTVDLSQFAGEPSVYVAIRHCGVVHHYYLYADDVMVTGIQTDICTTHDLSYVPAKAATCTEEGNIAYYHCNTCLRNYLDEAGSEQIYLSETAIPSLGHTLNEAEPNNNGTHTGPCARCGEQVTFDCTYRVATEDGALKHTCSLCGYSYSEPVEGDKTVVRWGFESGKQGWTFVDRDGDDRSYVITSDYTPHSGTYCLNSYWNWNANVDNWAISPAFSLEGP